MAALANSVHTYVREETTASSDAPPAKKHKKGTDDTADAFSGLTNAPHDVSGIANAIFANGRDQVFVMKGDRHFWVGETKKDFAALFHDKGDNLKGAPFQVYTVNQGHLTFLGTRFEPIEQARWILKHMLSKGWAPRCCFDTREDAIAAVEKVKNKDYSDICQLYTELGDEPTVTDEELQFLYDKMLEFTQRVSTHPYFELVMGAVEPKATRDVNAVVDTLYKETYEEAGAKKEDIQDKVQFFDWSDPFTSRKTGATSVSAIFVTEFENGNEMLDIWRAEDKKRRPAGQHTWRCPHAWYKALPGIEGNEEALANAAHEKAIQETRSGDFYAVDVVLTKENFMDNKNKAVLRKILGK